MSARRVAVVVFGALVLQVCLFSRFNFDGARPDVMVLVAVMAGFVLGPDRGAIVGFASGMAFDVLLSTPLGLSALVYTIVAFVVGRGTASMVRTSRWIPPAVAAVGSAAAMVLYAVIGVVLGEATLEGPPLAAIVTYVAVFNAVLAPLALRAVSWTRQDESHRRHPFFAR